MDGKPANMSRLIQIVDGMIFFKTIFHMKTMHIKFVYQNLQHFTAVTINIGFQFVSGMLRSTPSKDLSMDTYLKERNIAEFDYLESKLNKQPGNDLH